MRSQELLGVFPRAEISTLPALVHSPIEMLTEGSGYNRASTVRYFMYLCNPVPRRLMFLAARVV